jgi:[NiFe] hydrogenase assembly HybE family chaperone
MTTDHPRRAVGDTEASVAVAFRDARVRMDGLPIVNPLLDVATVGFRRHGAVIAGIVVTPWCMTLVTIPDEAALVGEVGSMLSIDYPAGPVDAVVGTLAGVGRYASTSLFSPMEAFVDQATAVEAAEAAVEALFCEPREPRRSDRVGRRGFLFGDVREVRA